MGRSSARMRLRLCGGLRIEVEGEQVEHRLTRRKSRELLALLAIEEAPVPRSRLVELLWPDDPPGSRSAALRQLLSDLRRVLGAGVTAGRSDVQLRLPQAWIDVVEARVAVSECAMALDRGEWELVRARAAMAAELLEGEFLAGQEAEWVEERRRELEQVALEALEGLAIAALAEPGHEVVAESAGRRLIERSPFRETGYTLLMRAQVARGNAAEALVTYERLRVLLRDELGTTPSLGTSALHVWALEQAAPETQAPSTELEQPVAGYARRPDGVSIAYHVIGRGPVDLVIVPGFMSHLDCWWTFPQYRDWLRTLASFARVITLDKAGTGASDPVNVPPTVEEWTDDVLSVMDAVGSARAVLFGISEAGPVTIAFADRHPERVCGLVLYAALARLTPAPHYLWEHREDIMRAWERFAEVEVTGWGHGASVDRVSPTLAATDAGRRAWAVFERASGSPASIATRTAALSEIDACPLLARVQVPTLVLHRVGDQVVLVHHGRFLGRTIPGAEYLELPGCDHPPPMGTPEEVDAVNAAIETFVRKAGSGTLLSRPPGIVVA